jgi:nitrate reductase beta subunit
MQKFIEMCEKGAYSPQNSDARDALHKVKAMLSRVLEVDLSTTANRKGKVPSALGITGKKVDIMWRIIMLTWDEVEDYLIRTNQRRMSNTGIASAICEGLSICEIWNEEQIPSEDTIRKHYANNLHKLI